ncbi:MAG: hypothetical protein E6G49_06090, partial [Actinobacteria bacterium]
ATFPPGTAPGRGSIGASALGRHVILTTRSGSASMTALERFFADAGLTLHVSCDSADPFLLRCLASAGFGTAVLPRSLTEREGPAVDVRPLRPAIRLPVALLWRRRGRSSNTCARLRRTARRKLELIYLNGTCCCRRRMAPT